MLRRSERFKLILFLKGNGCKDEWIRAVAMPRLRNDDGRRYLRVRHVESLLADFNSTKYDRKYDYFDLERQAYYFLGGEPNTS